MKNFKNILIIILLIIIFGGILFFYKIYLPSEREKDYFNKKIQCEKYGNNIKLEIEERQRGSYISPLGIEIFEVVFYSPRENSCIYVTERMGEKREYFVFNALTKSKITSFKFPDQWNDYKKFILEYSNGEIRL